MRRILQAAVLLLAGGWTATASACPLCQSEIGDRVRAGILDEGFAVNLVATVLPFAVFLALIVVVNCGGRPATEGRS